MKDIADKDLLQMIRVKPEQGFRSLVQQYQQKLYAHIRRMVIVHEDCNDVLQNTLIKAFRNIGKFEEKSSLYTWLYRIATNESLNFINKRNRIAAQALDNEELGLKERLIADSYFDGNEAQILLQEALVKLPQKQRLVFNMRYFDEMPYKKMSGVLETSEGALKASYHHAVKKIEDHIKKLTDYEK